MKQKNPFKSIRGKTCFIHSSEIRKGTFSPPAQDLTNHSIAKIPVYFGLYNI